MAKKEQEQKSHDEETARLLKEFEQEQPKAETEQEQPKAETEQEQPKAEAKPKAADAEPKAGDVIVNTTRNPRRIKGVEIGPKGSYKLTKEDTANETLMMKIRRMLELKVFEYGTD